MESCSRNCEADSRSSFRWVVVLPSSAIPEASSDVLSGSDAEGFCDSVDVALGSCPNPFSRCHCGMPFAFASAMLVKLSKK